MEQDKDKPRSFHFSGSYLKFELIMLSLSGLGMFAFLIVVVSGVVPVKVPNEIKVKAPIGVLLLVGIVPGVKLTCRKLQRRKRPELELFRQGIVYRPVDLPNYRKPWYVPRYAFIIAEATIGRGLKDRTYFLPWRDIDSVHAERRLIFRNIVIEPVRPFDPIESHLLPKSATLDRIVIKEDEHQVDPADIIDAIESYRRLADQAGNVIGLPSVLESESIDPRDLG